MNFSTAASNAVTHKCILTFLSTFLFLSGICATGRNFAPEIERELYEVSRPPRITNEYTFPNARTSNLQLKPRESRGEEENPVIKKRRLDSPDTFNTNVSFGLEDDNPSLNYCIDDEILYRKQPVFPERLVQGTESLESEFSQNHFPNYQPPIHFFTQIYSQNSYPTLKSVKYPPNHFDQVNYLEGGPRFPYSTAQFLVYGKDSSRSACVSSKKCPLFNHLWQKQNKLEEKKGKLEITSPTEKGRKSVLLLDLCWEAVKSYVVVAKKGLSVFKGPPNDHRYLLKRVIPENEKEQKELMSQVAQMVCAAIRLKFDEVKLFSLLDWYKVRMEGVWEELVQSGDEFVEEVDEFLAVVTASIFRQ